MPITTLSDGTPDERERMAKAAALANRLNQFLTAQKVTEGEAINAIGLLFADKSKTAEDAGKYATHLSVTIGACFRLKQ